MPNCYLAICWSIYLSIYHPVLYLLVWNWTVYWSDKRLITLRLGMSVIFLNQQTFVFIFKKTNFKTYELIVLQVNKIVFDTNFDFLIPISLRSNVVIPSIYIFCLIQCRHSSDIYILFDPMSSFLRYIYSVWSNKLNFKHQRFTP